MTKEIMSGVAEAGTEAAQPRPMRADARRSEEALLEAALAVFNASGVDAPVRDIAERAGVGIGTLYRRFPQRADLIVAVFRRQVDDCADDAPLLARAHGPGEAVSRWMLRYADFLMAKRGLASALHSGDPAYHALPAYFDLRLEPALRSLIDAAAAAGEVRADIAPRELLRAVGNLCCAPASGDGGDSARRMVTLLVDGLRYGAGAGQRPISSI